MSITPTDFVAMAVAVIALGVVVVAVQKTRMGKATRAVSDNPSLASSAGINVERVITFVWIVGAALAGLSAASCSASPSRCPSRWASRSCC